jgi:hypothetical protein
MSIADLAWWMALLAVMSGALVAILQGTYMTDHTPRALTSVALGVYAVALAILATGTRP